MPRAGYGPMAILPKQKAEIESVADKKRVRLRFAPTRRDRFARGGRQALEKSAVGVETQAFDDHPTVGRGVGGTSRISRSARCRLRGCFQDRNRLA